MTKALPFNADELVFFRELRDFSITELAKATEIPRDRLERIETGAEKPIFSEEIVLSRVLAVPMSFFHRATPD